MVRRKKLIVMIVIIFLFTAMGIGVVTNEYGENKYEKVVRTYLQSLKSGNVEKAAECVLFTDSEIKSGLREIFCDAYSDYDINYYTIDKLEKLNESICIAHITINTNYVNADKSVYTDIEFKPFVVCYDGDYKIAFYKEQVPEILYEDIGELPYNYEGNPEYIVFK